MSSRHRTVATITGMKCCRGTTRGLWWNRTAGLEHQRALGDGLAGLARRAKIGSTYRNDPRAECASQYCQHDNTFLAHIFVDGGGVFATRITNIGDLMKSQQGNGKLQETGNGRCEILVGTDNTTVDIGGGRNELSANTPIAGLSRPAAID